MSLSRILHDGLRVTFDSRVVAVLAGSAVEKAAQTVVGRFTVSANELALALQRSYGCSLTAIGMGLAQGAHRRGLINRISKVLEPKVCTEFSDRIESEYLLPYAQARGLNGERLEVFRKQTAKGALRLSSQAEAVLPLDGFADPDLASVVTRSRSEDMTGLILTQITSNATIDDDLANLLTHEGLLGDAVLFFFREQLRKDTRVAETLRELQAEGFWADLSDLRGGQDQLIGALERQAAMLQESFAEQQQALLAATETGDLARVGELAASLQVIQGEQAAIREREERLPLAMEEARKATVAGFARVDAVFGDLRTLVDARLDEILDGIEGVGEEVRKTRRHVDAGVEAILGEFDRRFSAVERLASLMSHIHLGAELKASDEFTQHTRQGRETIQAAVAELKQVPRSATGYNRATITVASALSSAGETARAEAMFDGVRRCTTDRAEDALAAYNLFWVRLRRKAWGKALAALNEAIAIDPVRYALHDVGRYPVERILGAGGMGCAFLCSDLIHGHVVVKTFWDARPGPLEEVFAEVATMARVGGKFIPRPVHYGYADSQSEERPYIVMEHISDAVDGEAWLKANGPLDAEKGIRVGIQVAEGLAVAHGAGICHFDLKPANLLLRDTGEGLEVRIIDFGLARAATSLREEAAAKSRSGKSLFAQEVFGTLDYAAPEQLGETRRGAPGPKSDLFGFGATLYRLLTGDSPRTVLTEDLPEVPPLRGLIGDCLRPDPARRPKSAEAAVMRLREALDVTAPTASSPSEAEHGLDRSSVDTEAVSGDGRMHRNERLQDAPQELAARSNVQDEHAGREKRPSQYSDQKYEEDRKHATPLPFWSSVGTLVVDAAQQRVEQFRSLAASVAEKQAREREEQEQRQEEERQQAERAERELQARLEQIEAEERALQPLEKQRSRIQFWLTGLGLSAPLVLYSRIS